MHHPDFSWLCPLKNIRMNLNSKIITYSHQVGLVGCCFHAGTIGLLWHLYNWLTPSTPDLHAGCSGSTEESAWMPKHALELYWWLLFKAGSEGLKEQTRQHVLCLKARGWWIRETSGNISNTPPMSQKHCYVYLPHLPSKTDAKWAIMSWQLSKISL